MRTKVFIYIFIALLAILGILFLPYKPQIASAALLLMVLVMVLPLQNNKVAD